MGKVVDLPAPDRPEGKQRTPARAKGTVERPFRTDRAQPRRGLGLSPIQAAPLASGSLRTNTPAPGVTFPTDASTPLSVSVLSNDDLEATVKSLAHCATTAIIALTGAAQAAPTQATQTVLFAINLAFVRLLHLADNGSAVGQSGATPIQAPGISSPTCRPDAES